MKKEIEDKLILNERILQLWEADSVLDITKGKHLKVKTNKIKTDSGYDVDEVTVELISNNPMSPEVQIRTVIHAMRQFESDPLIRKVIHNSHTLSENKLEGEVIFTIISSIDK